MKNKTKMCVFLWERLCKSRKIFLIFALIMSLSMQTSASVDWKTDTLSINEKNINLADLIFKIGEIIDCKFIFNSDDLDEFTNLSVKKSGTTEEVLDFLLNNKGLTYKLNKNSYVISKKKFKNPVKNLSPPKQEKKEVKGIVVDKDGIALPGVSVVIKGTTIGVSTNTDGEFNLDIQSQDAVLVFSFVGMTPKEVSYNGQQILSVVLEQDAEGLEEVIIVGYGFQKKENISGAVTSVSPEVLENRPITSIGEGLQGTVANLNISMDNGRSSSVPNINIRGYESINGGSPLIIIDGVASSSKDLARLNPNDVESMSVLKDAASCAIYGARASFGVLLIKTKEGSGGMKVSYNYGMSFRTPTELPNMVTDPYRVMVAKETAAYPYYSDLYPDEHVEYAKKVSEGTAENWRMNPSDTRYWQHFASTDWFDVIYRDYGVSQNQNFAVSGREKKMSYYFSGAMIDEDGIFNHGNDEFKRYNLRNKMTFEITDWLKVGNNTSWENTLYDEPSHQSRWLLFNNINRTDSRSPVYNPDGSFTSAGAYMVGGAESSRAETKTSNIQTQMTAELSIFKDVWKINADYTIKKSNWNKSSFNIPVPYKTGPEEPVQYQFSSTSAWRGNSTTMYKGLNLYTTIAKKINKHSLVGVFGYNEEESIYEQFEAGKKDLISPNLPTIQLATGEAPTIGADYTDWAIRGAFGRLNYIFDDKYIFEVNARYDGSSRFPTDDRFGLFPSFSLGWRLDKENFMPELNWLNMLKPRISWGSLGNQSVSDYAYIASMSSKKVKQILGGGQPIAVYKPGLVAGNLTWEKVESLNLGLDVSLFDNKFSGTFEYYERLTKDMLTKSKSLPSVLGTSEPKENAADLKNQGWEVTLTWRETVDVGGSPLSYSVNFNISDSRSWITKYDNPSANLRDYYVGREIGEIWGLQSLGLYQTPEEVQNHAYEDHLASDEVRYKAVGDVQWKDLDGDGKITKGSWRRGDSGDYTVIGNNQSRYRYGINLTADWKGIDLRLFGQGVGKRDYYPGSGNHYFWGILAQPWAQVSEHIVNDVWTQKNTEAYFPRLKAYAAEDGHLELGIPQTRYLINTAYFRLKNVTVGYSLPQRWINKYKLSKLRFYVSGENLITISDITKFGMDPEVLSGTGNYPLQKKYSFGVNVTF